MTFTYSAGQDKDNLDTIIGTIKGKQAFCVVYGANPFMTTGAGTANVIKDHLPNVLQSNKREVRLQPGEAIESIVDPTDAMVTRGCCFYPRRIPHQKGYTVVHSLSPCLDTKNGYFSKMEQTLRAKCVFVAASGSRSPGEASESTPLNPSSELVVDYDNLTKLMLETYSNAFDAILRAKGAHGQEFQEVYLPSLGDGVFRVPHSVSFHAMAYCLQEYKNEFRRNLLSIHVVGLKYHDELDRLINLADTSSELPETFKINETDDTEINIVNMASAYFAGKPQHVEQVAMRV